jgi:DNA-binding MarR family transcriptional regulator
VLSAIQHHAMTTPATLASFIGIDRAAITRHLDRLEKQGLAKRHHSETDRRVVNILLTQKGDALISDLAAASMATNAKFTTGHTETENDTVRRLLKKMLSKNDADIADL